MSVDPSDVTAPMEPEPPTAEAIGAVGLAILVLALLLMAAAPFAAKPVPDGKEWFLAPVNWPLLSLGMMAVTGFALSWPLLFGDGGGNTWKRAGVAYEGLLPAIGYSLLFCGYLALLNFAGFAISSLIFGQICLSVSGLRSWKWAFWNLFFTATLIVILRIGMGMYFPFAPLFKLMPPWLGNPLGGIL